ncbi:hypothetical protein [Haloarcula marismortui]|uniref:Right handed beta helix domain-containing protein n=3 Tax=Haloarcula marismortui ATCC 33800 TaxID=662476 RepID=A0A8T8KLG1_9EURY|nr:hypothetical protein [Haloarcula sinaiiensis]QUJ74707.1 hypothetical protein KDQ40_21105 [Haloarcula sinaiiensis ATCC 33800]
MRRRKLLIGIGATAAGGSAAFGTEAFTSVQAERNVDVAVAGDQSSFIAIQPLDSANAGKYVNTESDNTVGLELDGDNSGSGEGVTQDAITQLEDLFRVVNQGSQEVSVYFEDDSDAVTFRVTRSTETSTNGSNGQSLEGAANSVELGVGEQIVVGLTVDTLNNDVSGQLLDNVTLYADANASAPEQSIPEPQYVVDGDGDEPNTFADLSSALSSGEVDAGAVVGVDGSVSITESTAIDISTDDVTVTGFNGRPTIDRDVQDGAFIEASGDGVSIRNLEITEEVTGAGFGGERSILVSGSDVTLDGVRVENQAGSGSPKGNPTIAATGEDTTITNCESINAPISANGASGSLTLTNNYVENVLTEGIFSFGSTAGELDFTVENNEVVNHDIDGENSKEIKIVDNPASVNGESSKAAQIESLLIENAVNSVQVSGDAGTRATPDIVGSGEQFTSVNEVLKPGIQDGTAGGSSSQSALVALFESGEYDSFEDPVKFDKANAVIKGLSRPTLNYDGGYPGAGITFSADNISVENIEFDFFGASNESSKNNFSGGSGLINVGDSDVTFRNAALNVVFVEEDGSVTFDTKGGLSLGNTPGASFINVDVGILNRQAGRPISLDRGRPGGFFVIGQEIRDCTLRGGPKIATGSVADPTVVDNTLTDVANSESLAIDSSAESATVEGNSIEYDDSDPRIGKAFGGAEIRMESNTTDVNGQNLADAQAVANELSQANSGSQLASGNAVVVNRSADPNIRAP